MDATKRGLLAGAAATLLPSGARAQGEWPTRPIRLVVPFAAGGAADSAARAITPVMAQKLGQTIVVENRTGAPAASAAARSPQAPGDGYTLLWDASVPPGEPGAAEGAALRLCQLRPGLAGGELPRASLAVKADFPGRSVAEFIRQAKERPGAISVGTQGNATAGPYRPAGNSPAAPGSR